MRYIVILNNRLAFVFKSLKIQLKLLAVKTTHYLGLQNSGNFHGWKFSMGINGNIWDLMGINWEIAELHINLAA